MTWLSVRLIAGVCLIGVRLIEVSLHFKMARPSYPCSQHFLEMAVAAKNIFLKPRVAKISILCE